MLGVGWQNPKIKSYMYHAYSRTFMPLMQTLQKYGQKYGLSLNLGLFSRNIQFFCREMFLPIPQRQFRIMGELIEESRRIVIQFSSILQC